MSKRLRLLPPRLSALVVVPVLVVALAGCGGGDDDANEKIEAVARGFAGDVHDKDWDGVCRSFSKKAHEQIKAAAAALKVTNCPAVVETAFTQSSGNRLQDIDADQVKVTNIKVDGNKATADVSPSADQDPKTHFVKEGEAWKIDADPATAGNTTTITPQTTTTGG